MGISLNPSGADARTVLDAARAAEDAGFDAVWVYDHLSGAVLSGRNGCLDVFTLLGSIATATRRVSIGPLVLNVTLTHPSRIAVSAATLQDLSGGRLMLGLGAGAGGSSPFAREVDMFRLPRHPDARRREMVADTIGFLRALWRGDDRYSGTTEWARFERPDGVSIPDPAPPIVVGANGPKMAAVAGRLADGINLHHGDPRLAAMAAEARASAAEAGRPDFLVTVEAPWTAAVLDPDSPQRAELDGLGVDQLSIGWHGAIGLDAIGRASHTAR